MESLSGNKLTVVYLEFGLYTWTIVGVFLGWFATDRSDLCARNMLIGALIGASLCITNIMIKTHFLCADAKNSALF